MRTTTASWPKVFAYIGLAVMGFVLAYFSTAVATGGIGIGNLGRAEAGRDLLMLGSAMLLVGVAFMAAFGYLAMVGAVTLAKARRKP